MLDIKTIEKLESIATPFYYYDMALFRRTLDHVAELAKKHNINQSIIWDMMKEFERKVAKRRGLM